MGPGWGNYVECEMKREREERQRETLILPLRSHVIEDSPENAAWPEAITMMCEPV